jgi:hypothetical protein
MPGGYRHSRPAAARKSHSPLKNAQIVNLARLMRTHAMSGLIGRIGTLFCQERNMNRRSEQWQDTVNIILSIWLFISPWVLGYASGTHESLQLSCSCFPLPR